MAKRMTPYELEQLVALCPLFAPLEHAEIKRIVEQSTLVKYQKGDFIVRKGELALALMLVTQGEVLEVVIDRNEFSSVAKIRYRGDFFSELSIISELPSNTSVVSQGNCSILLVPKEVFLEIFWNSPAMIRYIILLQSQRLVQAAERSASHTLIRTEGRLAFALLTLESESGQTGIVKVTHEFLGQYCGLARQTVSLLLEEWQRMDLIATGYRQVKLLDREGLNEIFMSETNFKT